MVRLSPISMITPEQLRKAFKGRAGKALLFLLLITFDNLQYRIGQTFPNRRALHDANVHRGLQQGISPQGASIILSGGYVDDVDERDLIIYTGEGGRDQTTGRQIADQVLVRGNAALARNFTEGNPVRVIRGHTSDSLHAPEEGWKVRPGLSQVVSGSSEAVQLPDKDNVNLTFSGSVSETVKIRATVLGPGDAVIHVFP